MPLVPYRQPKLAFLVLGSCAAALLTGCSPSPSTPSTNPTTPPAPAGPEIQTIVAHLPVGDVDKASQLYHEVFGLQEVFREGQAYALLQNGPVELALYRAKPGVSPATCMLRVRDIKPYYRRCIEADWHIVSPLETKPWGMEMFMAQDPDGNTLDFGETVAK